MSTHAKVITESEARNLFHQIINFVYLPELCMAYLRSVLH